MKKVLVAVAILLAIAVLVPAVNFVRYRISLHQRLYGKARKEWKQAAVTDLARKVANSTWLSNEVAAVAAQIKTNSDAPDDNWFSGHLLLARSGEWMLYTNICSKSDRRIHDLFIGLGSNGKWYFSTYHFCIEMVVLRMTPELEGQPASLQQFVWAYYLQEFDGRSDDCLQETWNPKLWRRRAAAGGGSGP